MTSYVEGPIMMIQRCRYFHSINSLNINSSFTHQSLTKCYICQLIQIIFNAGSSFIFLQNIFVHLRIKLISHWFKFHNIAAKCNNAFMKINIRIYENENINFNIAPTHDTRCNINSLITYSEVLFDTWIC